MITDLAQLRALYASPGERAVRKQLDRLDVHGRRFVALAPFCVIASAGQGAALLDASPRGGAPGFVKASDDGATLLLPDSGGNNRLDTLENLLADPRVALLFLVPGVDETLRVNGTARLRDEAEFVDAFAQERQRPKLVIEVAVREAYLHCAKAFMRSQLWQPASWGPRDALPSMGQMIRDQIGGGFTGETEAQTLARYRAQLAEEQAPSAG
ncbi:Pyridoxamine 5'-phosphate oxidase [Xylophilus ampelinus]|nr:pyridoxamine 5'-phosphate oxidase family protein [Variovorax sp.]VTY40231.1 Pyridoxamine 5'-phosphate oxidase [Xylophilus ampelinus]